MMYGNSKWTGSYTALFYSTPALRVFYTKVFLYWRHAWQWLYGAAEQWQWHECENTYGGFLWLDLHQNMKYFGGKGSNSSEFKPGESEWRSTVFQKWLCYLDVSISNFAVIRRDITTTKSQHTSQNGNYFYCFPISLWVSMSKLSAHPISGGIGQDGLCHSVTVLVPTQLPGSRFDGDGQGQAATVTHHPVHTRHVG